MRHGLGKLFKKEKEQNILIYEGYWSHDLPHGKGKMRRIF